MAEKIGLWDQTMEKKELAFQVQVVLVVWLELERTEEDLLDVADVHQVSAGEVLAFEALGSAAAVAFGEQLQLVESVHHHFLQAVAAALDPYLADLCIQTIDC